MVLKKYTDFGKLLVQNGDDVVKRFVNKALEELSEVKPIKESRNFRVMHCSQFNSYSYLKNVNQVGVCNSQKMMRLYRFSLAVYCESIFVGTLVTVLDIVGNNQAYILGMSSIYDEVGVLLLENAEKICRIMDFNSIKIRKNKFNTIAISEMNKNELVRDRWIDNNECYIKALRECI